MTNVKLYVRRGRIIGLEVEGHTEFAEHGEDIVCAAVSTLAQALIVGLVEVLQLKVSYKIKDGYLSCFLPEELTADQWQTSQIVFQTIVRSLDGVREGYSDFLHIEEVHNHAL